MIHIGGKIEQHNRVPVKTRDDLSMAYTPGVARVCQAIADDPAKAFQYTIKRNTVAVVSDGTAVLGLGDIGPRAAMPVMEGKAMLFKEFAGVDALPDLPRHEGPRRDRRDRRRIAPTFGGINLEDISAPRCFEIEERLKAAARHPRLPRRPARHRRRRPRRRAQRAEDHRQALEDLRVLCVGVGAAGVAVTKILLEAGVRDVIGCDSKGALSTEREDYLDGSMNAIKRWYAEHSNPEKLTRHARATSSTAWTSSSGSRARASCRAEALARMTSDAMVFAMANPNPEVTPEEAAPYARIIATGRSDYPNQINNVLAFPGIFRGALDVRARADHRGDEDRRRARRSPTVVADARAARGLHHPVGVQPRRRARAWPTRSPSEAAGQGAAQGGNTIGFAAVDSERLPRGPDPFRLRASVALYVTQSTPGASRTCR